ncbi:MAG: ribonuclease III [Cyclobacteriaceae bacterium]|nr:ribonuclease III [Cyclobacteriaceae bacterium]MCH8515605.1 ribonuclease III [Cyclobacteriaceae bacterium]
MNVWFKFLKRAFTHYSYEDKRLQEKIFTISGLKPFNLSLYYLATCHSSVAKISPGGIKESNERLEYLGDAILGAIVADFLFLNYPYKEEGFLTEIRSRIVNRESLNLLSKKVGIASITRFSAGGKNTHKSIFGDALEAFVGAVYLDHGYEGCRSFVIDKLIEPHIDIDKLINENLNYKSLIIEWAQKENRALAFEVSEKKSKGIYKQFEATVILEGKEIGIGHGLSKKKAEQNAAHKTCEELNILSS